MAQRNTNPKTCARKYITTISSISKGNTSPWVIISITGILIITGVMLFKLNYTGVSKTPEIIVYKSPSCNCCNKWVDHLRSAGFSVTTRDTQNMNHIKLSSGIRPWLQSCHTALVDNYVIEGHVPADDIKRLLQERPVITGLTVPGMPVGSPGMEGDVREPFDVLTFDRDGRTKVYNSY